MAAGRKTGGRQKGSKNKATRALEAAAEQMLAGLPPDTTALALAQAIYRNGDLPLPVRMKAMADALPYESPRLAAIDLGNKDGDPFVIQIVKYANNPSA